MGSPAQQSLFKPPDRDTRLRVGPAGWNYRDWERTVYPAGAGARFDALGFLAAEAQRDASDDARRFAYAAGAAGADAETKRRYFEAFLHEDDLPERWIEEALPAFNAVEHREVTREYLEAALTVLPELKARHKIFFVNAWLSAFVGGQADGGALAAAEMAAADPALAPDLRRKLLEVTDELARTVAIRRAGPNTE